MNLFWSSSDGRLMLAHGDAIDTMGTIPEGSVDLIFADPPYFLSNGGTTCKSGKRASVHKGAWDKSPGVDEMHDFNRRWLQACKRVLHPNGTIWVSGTSHVIHSVGFAMQQIGFKMLNDITWEKPNPPPNLACRYFTHATETILWAARDKKSRYHYDYAAMKIENGGKQMKSVWRMMAPGASEKAHGSYPTQKPIELLSRIVRASTRQSAVVLDPFNGSGTTGVVCALFGRRYVGIDNDEGALALAHNRIREAIEVREARSA